MHLILTGATGLIGTATLHHLLSAPKVTKITILSRRPVPLAANNPKVTTIIHEDYTSYPPALLADLRGAQACIWALGVSINDVSKEEYEKITVDYAVAAAKAFSGLNDPFTFVYVSGEGAAINPTSTTPNYGLAKGRAEAALLALQAGNPSLRPYSVRPGYVDASGHPAASFMPSKKLWMKGLEAAVAPPLRWFWSGMVSPAAELAEVMTDIAVGGGEKFDQAEKGVEEEGRVLGNVWLRKLAAAKRTESK
ncbi:hypothetical protein V493_06129 [Pseudogymnoascus sp. VKM F-4281 (FW-2241)]|nr:hypothetical protein V493_06129 [Pseudogymnoascus sp. VKM F-4281 (FW-2241)]